MLLTIDKLLNAAQLDKIHEILAKAEYEDGKVTAGMAAARVKHNQELKLPPRSVELLLRIIMSTLGHNATFRSAALPLKMADPIFARYQPGMTYGDHVDDPIMGASGPKFRTDVSMTIFLNDADAYAGGELVIRTTWGEKRVKLNAGDAVIYPSASVHRVDPVTDGERLVCVTWIQSFVRDAARRELLFELDQAREVLLKNDPDSDTTKQVDRSYVNLLRMWSDC